VPVLLYPQDAVTQSIVGFILAGISGAAVAGLAFDAWTSGVFIASFLVPLALRLLLGGTPQGSAMAALVCIYLVYLAGAIRRGQRQFLQLLDWRSRAETARAQAQRQALRHAVLAQANQLGAAATHAQAFFAAVCRVATDCGAALRASVQWLEDDSTDDRVRFDTEAGLTRACIPLHGQGRAVAQLCAVCVSAQDDDANLRDWLQNLAASLERGLQAIAQRARIEQLQKLYGALTRVGEVVLQSRSADEMVARTCDTLASGTQFHAAWLVQPGPDGAFHILARAGEGAAQLDHFRVQLDDVNRAPLVLRVWDTQTLQVCNDLLQDPQMLPWRQTLAHYRWHAALAAPVRRGGALWGVLVFTSPQAGAFDDQTIGLCEQVAALLGHGLDELDAKERLSQLQRIEAHRARHDPLTGLPNRYALEQYLPAVIDRASRHGLVFALGMIDLDGFKRVNDTWGHSAGDRVLRELTRRLLALRRQGDYLARLGGDEFIVVMEDLNPLEVRGRFAHSVQRLRQAVAAPFDIAPDVQLPMDMSIGIASYPIDARDAETLIRVADQAMYASKAAKSGAALR
jgi:diguanylate cyclase (GGDEF)-like protein